MYLFDLYDYYFDRVIGNQYEEIPICDIKWCDMATTARATRDAYLSNLSQWYVASVTCLEDGDCKDAILAKWVVVQNDITLYNNAMFAFWNMMCNETNLEDCTGEYNPTLYQNYINAQQTLQCDIEELTYLVDDGGSGVNPPPNPSINCSTSSLSGSGSRGIYYIPMVVPANVCDVQLTFDVAVVPDSLAIMSSDKTTYYAQTGYFGEFSQLPDAGISYTFGPGEFDGEIYKYDPLGVGNFVVDTLASPETLEIIAQEYPITNTDPTKIPISYNPASPDDAIRTITWNKGVTANDVNILIRIVGHPNYTSTVWDVTALTCVNCSSPTTTTTTTTIAPTTTTTTTVNPCPNCVSGDITIGTQVWAKCNLDVTTYRDGTPIPEVTDRFVWQSLTTGAWCWYNNDSANGDKYGKLYNWYAVAGIYDTASLNNPSLRKQLAPTDYHVPTDDEWTILTDHLGGLYVAGGKMKEMGLCHWNTPNTNATNTSLFTALPGGYRDPYNYFYNIADRGFWWSSTEKDAVYPWARYLFFDGGFGPVRFSTSTKRNGYSVRLIKD